MPTLLNKGSLRAADRNEAVQSKLDEVVPVQYIIDCIHEMGTNGTPDKRVITVVAQTASGKSTVMPAELFRKFSLEGSDHRTIVCTQPRVLTTISIPLQIQKYYDFLILGENLGYNTRNIKFHAEYQGLMFVTIGTLALELVSDTDESIMNRYQIIIVDEAHERSTGFETCISALKALLWRNYGNPRCPFVIITSATINAREYLNYMLTPPRGSQHPRIEPILTPSPRNIHVTNYVYCEGFSHKKYEIYLKSPAANYIAKCVEIIGDIVNQFPAPDAYLPGAARESDDILVFLPSAMDAEMITSHIGTLSSNRRKAKLRPFLICILNGLVVRSEAKDYMNATVTWLRDVSGGPYERRIIIATNVAETGITLDTLKYVIDVGLNNEAAFNSRDRIDWLIPAPTSLPRVIQRKGRIGRKFDGYFYAVYTEETMRSLPAIQLPDIIVSNITPLVLTIVDNQQRTKNGYFNIDDIDMFANPPHESIISALETAHALGFVARNPPAYNADFDAFMLAERVGSDKLIGITKVGRILVDMNATSDVSLEALRMILAGAAFGYRMVDLIDIAVFVSFRLGVGSTLPNFDAAYESIFGAQSEQAWVALLGDNFFTGAVFSAALDKFIAQTSSKKGLVTAQYLDWCGTTMKVSSELVLTFIELRSELRDMFTTSGFDIYVGDSIFYHSQNRPFDLANACKRYKACVFEGYRVNTARYDPSHAAYMTPSGLPVRAMSVSSILQINADAHVSSFVCDGFHCKRSKKGGTDINVRFISAYDGFAAYDPYFTS